MMNANTYKRAPVHVPNTYTVPSPAVQVSYSSAHDGSELLQPRVSGVEANIKYFIYRFNMSIHHRNGHQSFFTSTVEISYGLT